MANRWLAWSIRSLLLVTLILAIIPVKVAAATRSSVQVAKTRLDTGQRANPAYSEKPDLREPSQSNFTVKISEPFRAALVSEHTKLGRGRTAMVTALIKARAEMPVFGTDKEKEQVRQSAYRWLDRIESNDQKEQRKTLTAYEVELLIKVWAQTKAQALELRRLAYGPQLSIFQWAAQRGPPESQELSFIQWLATKDTNAPNPKDLDKFNVEDSPEFRHMIKDIMNQRGWSQFDTTDALLKQLRTSDMNIITEEFDKRVADSHWIERVIAVDGITEKGNKRYARKLTILEAELLISALYRNPQEAVKLRKIAYGQQMSFFQRFYNLADDSSTELSRPNGSKARWVHTLDSKNAATTTKQNQPLADLPVQSVGEVGQPRSLALNPIPPESEPAPYLMRAREPVSVRVPAEISDASLIVPAVVVPAVIAPPSIALPSGYAVLPYASTVGMPHPSSSWMSPMPISPFESASLGIDIGVGVQYAPGLSAYSWSEAMPLVGPP